MNQKNTENTVNKSSDLVAVDCIPAGSELEDPSLGVTKCRGLSSRGSFVEGEVMIEGRRELMIPVVGHPVFFVEEEANGVGLEKGIVVYKRCDLSSNIYLTCLKFQND